MKRKSLIALAGLALCGSLQAQDIYKVEMLSGSDLNGTARFVGMGGAMNALGADLSTMGTNPAAIGMYRRSDVAATASTTSQPNGGKLGDINKVVPIDKSSTVLSILLAAFLLGEGITLFSGIGITLIAVGTFLMIEKKDVQKSDVPKN